VRPENRDMKKNLLDEGKYFLLLGSLFLVLLIVPLREHQSMSATVNLVLYVLVLLSAINAVAKRRKYVWYIVGTGLVSLFIRIVNHFTPDVSWLVFGHVFAFIFLTLTIVQILVAMFREKTITYNTVAGSVCVYLLIGLSWGLLYMSIALLNPASFAVGGQPVGRFDIERIRQGVLLEFVYFSFETLTTLGYGDIIPLSPVVRSLAIIEALIGPLYLTVLVARFVGLHISSTIR
jgi:voltage-gated potassium channel